MLLLNVLNRTLGARSLLIFAAVLFVPFLRSFFLIIPLRPIDYATWSGLRTYGAPSPGWS